jgi:DNA modification methylase
MKHTIQLYNQDAFVFLSNVPDNSIDLVLIDPPYLISKPTNFINTKIKGTDTDRFRISTEFGAWDESFNGMSLIIQECYRILKQHGTLIVFYDIWKITDMYEFLDNSKFKQIRFIEWLKTNPVPINSQLNYLTNAREIALTGVKVSKPVFNGSYDNGVYHYPIYQGADRFHPTQKSLQLFEELIIKHSNKDALILDCFSGSGTTAIAAMNTQRNFIGCEIDQNYFLKSKERITINNDDKGYRCEFDDTRV